MNYDCLPPAYNDEQIRRITELRDRINQREAWVQEGRIIPEEADMVIGAGRRLEMAVLFLDICGFSGRANETQAEQELMLRCLNLFFSEMLRIAEDYGGVVEKNTGDGLMAYFNDGEGDPPEGGSKRAVAASLTMMHINRHLVSPILQNSGVEPFRFRIGIDHGTVTIAQLGAAKRFGALVAVGTTANVACKMLAKANPDEVIIGGEVFKRLPAEWQRRWCQLKTEDSGWVYRATGNQYPLYSFTGRWRLNSTK